MTPDSRNGGARLGKQVLAATNKQVKIDVLFSFNDGNGAFCWIRPEVI
jgi:hypothetical protein